MSLLHASCEIPVRFSEVDSLRIVWHGHYVQYFEEARQAFGLKYDLGYLQVHEQGYTIPIVKLNIDYKRSLRFGDHAVVEARFVPNPAAKIIFHYTIKKKTTGEVIATGETIQVFLDGNAELSLITPLFFEEWKKKWQQTDSE